MIRLVITFSVLNLLTFCSENKSGADKVFQERLLKLKDSYPLIRTDGWVLIYDVNNIDLIYYKGEKIYGDTVEVIAFYFYINGEVSLDYYLKKIFDGPVIHNIHMAKDTLFYFKEDTLNDTRDFVVGKYNYLYKYGELSSTEYEYYFLHRDSLSKVRGNNILPLPTVEKDLSDSLPGS